MFMGLTTCELGMGERKGKKGAYGGRARGEFFSGKKIWNIFRKFLFF
jgi:hypothetical protein